MAQRLSWWVIPGALFVLGGVITLVGEAPAAAPHAQPLDATLPTDTVVLRDATGKRSQAVSWRELTANALVLAAPAARAGERGTVTLWPLAAGRRAAKPLLSCTATVRTDGSIALAGVPSGDYDVQVVFGAGAMASTWTASAIEAPGEAQLAAPVR